MLVYWMVVETDPVDITWVVVDLLTQSLDQEKKGVISRVKIRVKMEGQGAPIHGLMSG